LIRRVKSAILAPQGITGMTKKTALLIIALALIAGALALYMRSGTVEPERSAAALERTARVEAPDITGRRGALVDEIVFTQESDVGKITELIDAGSHHVFAQGITNLTVFRRIRDSVRAAHDFSYGSTAELSLNPAGPRFENGRVNPFYVREIREALNRLINRRHIAEELYGGLAVPRYLPLNTAFPDYARLADVARALEVRYQHDPEGARRVIHHEMEKLGARLEGGRWVHEGAPVRLIVLIRTEDERKRVGDYVASLLEDAGFTVERLYRTAEEAARIWIAGDPRAGTWHIYTGGWVSTMIQRDLAGNLSYYYTPRGRPEPLWQAYRPDPELDKIAERLERRDYRTWEERQKLMARGLELAMRDSVRIWVVDQLNVWPRARNVRLAVDLAGGVSGSALWPYTLRFQDRVGGRVVFATPSILTQPWNPVAGSIWLFDTMIMRALQDNELLPDPYTGLHLPQRIDAAEVTVEQGVPVIRTHDWLTLDTAPEIRVPRDAWIEWDSESRRFLTVGEKHPQGITARTRTRVHYEAQYFQRRWHDGSQVSLADMVLPWILMFERADERSRLYDRSFAPTFEVFRRHFRGWRIVAREPLIVEIYSDQIYPDAEWIVSARTPSVSPWHTLALGIAAERAGELAFSSHKADRMKVDWMSFIAGPSLRIIERHLQAAREQGFVPYSEALGAFLREGEAAARYDALAEWHQQRRHFWVGNGPFYLHSVHPVERSVVVRRFEGFTDPAGKWLRFTRPEIPELDLTGPMVVETAEGAEFELRITFQGKPYPAEEIDMAQFMLFEGTGGLAAKGEARQTEPGVWTIALTAAQLAALGAGANSLEVAVSSRKVALPSFASHAFATVPRREAGAAIGSPQAKERP
jgi:peptide/nickel transport system substrate-binding protein